MNSKTMKDVIIKIKGTQGLDLGDAEVIEFTTEGTMEITDDGYVLRYDEGQMMGLGRVNTTLTAKSGGTVVLDREGELSSRLIIKHGRRTSCFYSIPQGELTLGIYGKNVEVNLNETGGTVKLEYAIDTDMKPLSNNIVEIEVK